MSLITGIFVSFSLSRKRERDVSEPPFGTSQYLSSTDRRSWRGFGLVRPWDWNLKVGGLEPPLRKENSFDRSDAISNTVGLDSLCGV